MSNYKRKLNDNGIPLWRISCGELSIFLYLKQLYIGVVPDWWLTISQIDHAPHVCTKPDCGANVGLIFAYQYWMWHRKQTDKCAMLKKFQYLVLVSDALVDTHLLHLRHQDLVDKLISFRIVLKKKLDAYL